MGRGKKIRETKEEKWERVGDGGEGGCEVKTIVFVVRNGLSWAPMTWICFLLGRNVMGGSQMRTHTGGSSSTGLG